MTKLPTRRKFLTATGLTCIARPWLQAASQCRAANRPAPAGSRELFDGKTLHGWHTNAKPIMHGTGGRWTVENGVLLGEQDPPGSGNGGILLTDRQFGDFELYLNIKPDWGANNSGVFLRCTEDGACFQMYVDYHENGNVGHLAGDGSLYCPMKPFKIHGQFDAHGTLVALSTSPDERVKSWGPNIYRYSCPPHDWIKTWRIGKWNTVRIRCTGKYPTITTWINGVRICQFDSATSPHRLFNKEAFLRKLGPKGHIALQIHGGKQWPKGSKCRWRNIRIREL